MHDDNPATHPELLQQLADHFRASDYDLKALIRALCNSQAYHRTSRPLAENARDDDLCSRMRVKALDARVLVDAVVIASDDPGVSAKDGRVITLRQKLAAKTGGQYGGNQRDLVISRLDRRNERSIATENPYGVVEALFRLNTELTNTTSVAVARLAKPDTPKGKVIEDIYLTVLSRRPSAAEVQLMIDHVSQQEDTAKAYAQVFWVLLNSAEFTCNR